MEEMNHNVPWQPYQGSNTPPPVQEKPVFLAGRKELAFGIFAMFCGLILCNFTLFGGFNLGFAIAAILVIIISAGYLVASGCRLTVYSGLLLTLSIVTAAAFARSDDGFVKFVMIHFLLISGNLGLCLLAAQNRRSPSGITSLLDAPRALFVFGISELAPAIRGVRQPLRNSGSSIKRGGAVLLGLLVTLPLLGLLIPLLMSADAAFEGLIQKLPEFDFSEAFVTVIFGCAAACVLYTQAVALRHKPKAPAATPRGKFAIGALSVNTVLIAVSLVYALYLISQLAYIAGGFSGILPEEFTMAEYARRGFFEMAWISAINLAIMTLTIAVVAKNEGKAPLSTRLLCLFIGLVTVFLVATASAKMFMYIDSFGLTRLRVLTEVIMVFLAISAITVSLWLFAPQLPYMKVLLIAALIIGAAVIWVDVDTVVAKYNVAAYQSGKLETVDLDYLSGLGDGAIPEIAKLVDDSDPEVAEQARNILGYDLWRAPDFRGWNYVNWQALELTKEYTK